MYVVFSLSFFLTGSDISPPLLLPFSFISQFPKDVASCFVSFPSSLSDCHLDSCPLLSLFLVSTTVYQDSYSLLYIRLTCFPVMASTQFLAATSFPASLVHTVFPGLAPRVRHTALLRFGINFFFILTYRLFEDYIIFYLLVY